LVNQLVVTVRDAVESILDRGRIMLVPHGTMVMVIDGAKMSLLRNRGTDFAPALKLVDHNEHHSAKTAELGSGKPGRSLSSIGHGRSAYESTDFHQSEEDAFVKAATERLNALAISSDLRFIVIAAPHVLGVMRKQYSADLHTRLVGEINRDYAARSAADIAALLRDQDI
jgi:protein required for attachment to host cells